MTFDEALKCLREGKKVRISTWATECNIELKEDRFVYPSGATYSLDTHDILSNHWGILKEKELSQYNVIKIDRLLALYEQQNYALPDIIYVPSAENYPHDNYKGIPIKRIVFNNVKVEGKITGIVRTLRM